MYVLASYHLDPEVIKVRQKGPGDGVDAGDGDTCILNYIVSAALPNIFNE